jgi:hypothetical protein
MRHLPILLSLHLRSLPTPTLMLFRLSYRLRLRRLDVPEG